MKASQNQLEDLLQLSGLDQALRSNINSANQTVASLKALDVSQEFLASAARVLDANNALENLQAELQRIDADLKVVEQRIAKDEALLEKSTNSKDISGLQSELSVLGNRKSELEDSELEIMEQIGGAEAVYQRAKAERAAIEADLAAQKKTLLQELDAQKAKVAELQGQRSSLAKQVPGELMGVYEQKSAKGIAIGRLNARECGACRMALTAANFDELSHSAADELIFCPECQAILVR